MMLRTLERDCLYLNWALPAASLPDPPSPLRYQLHPWQGEDYVFASAVLFYQEGLHVEGLPLPRLTYPQFNLRLYVLDGDGTPSVLFRCMLMPTWVVPGAKLLTHQPAQSARLDFPRPTRSVGEGEWTWRVARGGRLEVRAHPGSPQLGAGPRLGTWEETVDYIQDRPRGYAVENGGSLHCIEGVHHRAAIWPLRAELGEAGLLDRLLPLPAGVPWPALHSCWLCPEIPFVFELGLVPKVAMAPVPRAAATSRGAARTRRHLPAAARQRTPPQASKPAAAPRRPSQTEHAVEVGHGL